VVLALGVAFLLRTFVVQVFYIPSSSMVPTLQVDDRMVVEKLTYHVREPQRGDVVVFRGAPAATPVERPLLRRIARAVVQFVGLVPLDASDLVKRVAGLPGEEIEIVDGILHIDGVPHHEPYLERPPSGSFGPVVVPPDALFFLGDNRANSSDSRGRLGFVARERVVGRAVAVVWPFDGLRRLSIDPPVPLVPGGAVSEGGDVSRG
jgi:signal peptidase I